MLWLLLQLNKRKLTNNVMAEYPAKVPIKVSFGKAYITEQNELLFNVDVGSNEKANSSWH